MSRIKILGLSIGLLTAASVGLAAPAGASTGADAALAATGELTVTRVSAGSLNPSDPLASAANRPRRATALRQVDDRRQRGAVGAGRKLLGLPQRLQLLVPERRLHRLDPPVPRCAVHLHRGVLHQPDVLVDQPEQPGRRLVPRSRR